MDYCCGIVIVLNASNCMLSVEFSSRSNFGCCCNVTSSLFSWYFGQYMLSSSCCIFKN